MAMVYLLAGLLLFAVIGVPLAFSIGASCVAYLAAESPFLLINIPQKIWGGAFSQLMIAMPMFMMAGELMNSGGITRRIIDLCLYFVRPIRGGLGEVNVVASMIFGGISGSSVADTSALGSILIPSMEKLGYPSKVAAGITVASSTMGMIIPPSIPMIIFAMVSGASVGGLFMAGAIPGLLIGVSQTAVVYIISRRKGYHPAKTPFVMKNFVRTMIEGLPAMLMPVFIVVTVSFGICTATESAGLAVFYALIVGIFLYRELKWEHILKALRKTLIASATIIIIIGFTNIFTWILTMRQVPLQVAAFFNNLNLPRWVILLILDLLILFIGTFIDVSPAILLLAPILLPVMQNLGVSSLQFGAILITGMAIGLVTPPVGMCLNACTKINKMPIIEIFKGAAPYLICNILILIMITLIPQLTTWLPALLGY
jgi:tripartite ATP-independent transporter DctM subunit